MAEKRMFTQKIVDSDAFLDMPLTAQALYFHLNMRADDDGFVNNPKKIQRMIGASEDDLKLLIVKRFILTFDNGVIVIKHWRMHNLIRKDRYNPTQYQDQILELELKENGSYTEKKEHGNQMATSWQPNGNQMATQVRLGKDSIGKDSPSVIELILNDKSLFPVHQDDIDLLTELYPSVDIMQELRKMKGWLDSNPTKRKTKNGIKRFINSWLSREQDRGYPTQYQDQMPDYMKKQEKGDIVSTPVNEDTLAKALELQRQFKEK